MPSAGVAPAFPRDAAGTLDMAPLTKRGIAYLNGLDPR